MKYFFYSLIAGIFLIACNNNKENKTTAGETNVEVKQQPVRECYQALSGNDILLLKLERTGDSVTGNLAYTFAEKDSNHGTIDGSFHGDTLLATYNFASEGTNSKREVAFLKKNDQMLEGYGDIIEEGGIQKFKSPASLNFGKGFILKKVLCK